MSSKGKRQTQSVDCETSNEMDVAFNEAVEGTKSPLIF